MVGEVGVEPTKPEAMRLQRTPVSDLVLSQINSRLSLFALVLHYLAAMGGRPSFNSYRRRNALKLNEGVARDN